MKTETGSFTATSGSNTIVLDDDTLDIKGVFFQVCKNGTNVNGSTGFSDSVKNRGKWALYDTVKDSGRSTTYCVYAKKNSSGTAIDALRGKVDASGFATTGEFSMTFDSADAAYTVDFMVVGV